MNKKIIALAVATAFAAPMAAHAGATVYGKINMGVATVDNGSSAAPADFMGIIDMDSRFGIKGSEDLGNGLTAIFKMETALNMDKAGGPSFTRDKYLGLKGGFGTVKIGAFNTAYKNAYSGMDIFADSIGDVTGSGIHGTLDNRGTNMLGYSNKFGAISLDVNMMFSETDNNTDDDGLAVGVTWKGNGMRVSAAIVDQDDGDTGPDYTEGMRLGFQMKLGAGKLNVLHETQDNDPDVSTSDPVTTTVQYGMNMGKNMIGLSYSMVDGDGVDNDATMMTVGYHMNLSKMTKVAFAYTTVDNDANSNASGRIFNSNLGTKGTAGDDPSMLGAMVTHKF